MNVKLLSVFFMIMILMVGCTNVENNNQITNENNFSHVETKDVIYINDNFINMNYDIDGRAEEVNLLNEYNFLNSVLEQNNAVSNREIKIYLREYKGQEREEYSKFQENTIIFKLENRDNNFVEMNFSENKLLGDCFHILEEEYKDSTIENETVHIFEYPNPENKENVTGLAYFTVNGLNFRIKGYNISHKDFIRIIKTTINLYKK